MTPEFIALVIFVIVLAVIEYVYIKRGEPTISERVRSLFRLYPPFGVGVGLVTGLLMGHFFWCP